MTLLTGDDARRTIPRQGSANRTAKPAWRAAEAPDAELFGK
jgi:hypothetical protein